MNTDTAGSNYIFTLLPFFLFTSTGFCTCRGLTIKFEKHNTHIMHNLSNTNTKKYSNICCSQHKPYTLGAMLVSGINPTWTQVSI